MFFFPELSGIIIHLNYWNLNVLRHTMYTPVWVTTGWGVMTDQPESCKSSRVVWDGVTSIGDLLQYSLAKSAGGFSPGSDYRMTLVRSLSFHF